MISCITNPDTEIIKLITMMNHATPLLSTQCQESGTGSYGTLASRKSVGGRVSCSGRDDVP